MNLLLVDDNINVLEALEFGIDYQSLGVDQVFSAISAAKARDIIEKEQIDIMLTDIEMPNSSGLELLEWVNQKKYDIVTMFCTSYADFNYAQKAVELHSFDYFLKPIDFDDISKRIGKAVTKVFEKRKQKTYETYGEQWEKGRNSRRDSFWNLLMASVQDLSMQDIEEIVKEEALGFSMEDQFGMFLCRIENVKENFNALSTTMRHFIVKNIIDEKMAEHHMEPVGYYWYDKERMFVIYKSTLKQVESNICYELIQVFAMQLQCTMRIFPASPFYVGESRNRFEMLLSLEQNEGQKIVEDKQSEEAIIDIIKNYLEKHYREKISRKELENLVFLSSDYISKLFKKQTGETISDYLTGLRMKAAKELLNGTDLSVYQIADQTGYDNYTYFSRLFKSKIGCSPREYRKR